VEVTEKALEGGGKKKVKTYGTWLRVKDPLDVIRRSAAAHDAAKHITYPANVPASVWPFEVMMDAGGGSTKLVLKHICVRRADSVRELTLLAVLDGVKDTYDAIRMAFAPVLDAICKIMQERTYVSNLQWAPAEY